MEEPFLVAILAVTSKVKRGVMKTLKETRFNNVKTRDRTSWNCTNRGIPVFMECFEIFDVFYGGTLPCCYIGRDLKGQKRRHENAEGNSLQ